MYIYILHLLGMHIWNEKENEKFFVKQISFCPILFEYFQLYDVPKVLDNFFKNDKFCNLSISKVKFCSQFGFSFSVLKLISYIRGYLNVIHIHTKNKFMFMATDN